MQSAYDLLADPEKRKRTTPSAPRTAVPAAVSPARRPSTSATSTSATSSAASSTAAARGQSAQRGRRGNDVEVEVRVCFEDSLHGVEVTVPVAARARLPHLPRHGRGARHGAAPRAPSATARGVVATSQGLFALQQPCPRCRGMGTIVETPCPTCRGAGRERRTKRFTVKIPAGRQGRDADQAQGQGRGRLRRRAGRRPVRGHAGRADSKLYERRGDDLVVDVPVSYPDGRARRQRRGRRRPTVRSR